MRIPYQLNGYQGTREVGLLAGKFFDPPTIWYVPDSLRTKWSQGLCHVLQNSSKPRTPWIGMLGCRVEQVLVECSDVQRHRQHSETEDCGVRTDEALGDHGDEVGLGHDMQCLKVMRNS